MCLYCAEIDYVLGEDIYYKRWMDSESYYIRLIKKINPFSKEYKYLLYAYLDSQENIDLVQIEVQHCPQCGRDLTCEDAFDFTY